MAEKGKGKSENYRIYCHGFCKLFPWDRFTNAGKRAILCAVTKYLNASYALYLSLYWMSACFVYGYTRLFMDRLGYSADQVGLVLALDCAAAMVLQPLLARAMERSERFTLRHVLILLCLVALVSGGLLLLPLPRGAFVCLFAAMSIMTMTLQPFMNAVGFDYINRGQNLNFAATRGIASLAFALVAKAYAALAEVDLDYLLVIYLLFTAGILAMSLLLAGKGKEAPAPRSRANRGSLLKSYPFFFGMLLGMVLIFFQHGFLDAYLYDIILAVGGDTRSLGTALLIGAAVETPMMLMFAWVERKFGVGRCLRFSAAAMALKTWFILLLGSVGGVYLMRFCHFFSYALLMPALIYYTNGRMADSDRVTGQALITGSISLAGMFSYLTGGLMVSAWGPMRGLLVCTLIGMVGGVLFILFCQKDRKQKV